MANIDILSMLKELEAHVKMIQNRCNKNSSFYTKNVSVSHSHSIRKRTEAVLTQIDGLRRVAVLQRWKYTEKNQARIKASGPLTQAIEDLLTTLDHAKNLTNNPVPNKTWKETICNPLKHYLRDWIVLVGKEPVITSTEENTRAMRDTMLKIKQAREKQEPIPTNIIQEVVKSAQTVLDNLNDPATRVLPTLQQVEEILNRLLGKDSSHTTSKTTKGPGRSHQK